MRLKFQVSKLSQVDFTYMVASYHFVCWMFEQNQKLERKWFASFPCLCFKTLSSTFLPGVELMPRAFFILRASNIGKNCIVNFSALPGCKSQSLLCTSQFHNKSLYISLHWYPYIYIYENIGFYLSV